MARRYIPASRTRSGSSSSSNTDAIRDQFLKELTSDANTLLQQLSQQFSQDLQNQSAQLLQGLFGDEDSSGIPGLSRLFSTGSRYLLANQPKVSTTTHESARSQDTTSQFRLSQSQAMAEASQAIGKGDKNL